MRPAHPATLPLAHTGMALQTLLPQGVIPLTMLGSYLYLGAVFRRPQIAGAALTSRPSSSSSPLLSHSQSPQEEKSK